MSIEPLSPSPIVVNFERAAHIHVYLRHGLNAGAFVPANDDFCNALKKACFVSLPSSLVSIVLNAESLNVRPVLAATVKDDRYDFSGPIIRVVTPFGPLEKFDYAKQSILAPLRKNLPKLDIDDALTAIADRTMIARTVAENNLDLLVDAVCIAVRAEAVKQGYPVKNDDRLEKAVYRLLRPITIVREAMIPLVSRASVAGLAPVIP